MVFYHFQNIRYLSDAKVNINSCTHSKELKDAIYRPYLISVEKVRKELKAQGIDFSVKKSYSSNPLIAFVQKNILQYSPRPKESVPSQRHRMKKDFSRTGA